MEKVYRSFTLRETERFLRTLPHGVEASLRANIEKMERGDLRSPRIKTLRGPIRELIIGNYRFVFFIGKDRTIYFTSAFRKKSQKTPRNEMEKAEQLYKEYIARSV